MATDLSTANKVTTTPIGTTPFVVDVTVCNLMADLTIKDFVVLVDGSVNNNSNWTKTNRTTLTYSGVAFGSAFTLEIRRVTPPNRYQEITFGTKFSSAIWEEEMNRMVRRAYEYALNGVGSGSITTIQTPQDTAFGVSWDGDTTYPATRNALYDKFVLMAPLASPTFTGTVVVPDQTDADNSTKAANTKYVDTRVANALSGSPVLGGNPTCPTQGDTNDSTRIANTAWVHDWYASRVRVKFAKTGLSGGVNTLLQIANGTEDEDTTGAWTNAADSFFTAPRTGAYWFTVSTTGLTNGSAAPTSHTEFIQYKINGGAGINISATNVNGLFSTNSIFSWRLSLTASDVVRLYTYDSCSGGTGNTTWTGDCYVQIEEVLT